VLLRVGSFLVEWFVLRGGTPLDVAFAQRTTRTVPSRVPAAQRCCLPPGACLAPGVPASVRLPRVVESVAREGESEGLRLGFGRAFGLLASAAEKAAAFRALREREGQRTCTRGSWLILLTSQKKKTNDCTQARWPALRVQA